jgi:dTDP-4-amino-4,6-dideoxygalactose transaminase
MAKLAINGGKAVLPKGLGVKWPQFDKKDEAALLKVFRSGKWWRGGDIKSQAESVCGEFERKFAKYHNSDYGLCVFNGTVAVECALRAAGVKAGDEVVVPSMSFVVSASAALPLSAIPVFADCCPDTYQPDPDSIEAAITPRTAAIVIVHFGGYPADLDRIVKIAKKHNLPLIEDCAHSQGSQWRGQGVGSYGDYGTFSFQQSKALTSGEGGIILAKDEERWQNAYRFHNLGRLENSGFYQFFLPSSNFRLTDLQGAILNSQFERLKVQVPQKMKAAKYLSKHLAPLGISALPEDKRITRRGYYYLVLKYNPAAFKGLHREEFLKAVQAEGVGMGHAYGTPIHKYPLFQDMKVPAKYTKSQYKKVSCPVTERILADECISFHQANLMADQKGLDKVIEAVAKVRDNVDELLAKKPCSCSKKK